MSFESSGAEYLRRLSGIRKEFKDINPHGNPRYKCAGSATFGVPGSTVRSWGTFTDLSISGCYVEVKTTFPAGALIDMELELNGIRAQVTGEVRASYPFRGMGGVAFRNLNAENPQQLAAMIESLRPSVQRVVARETMSSTAPVSLPIILNPGAGLRALGSRLAMLTTMGT